MKIAAVIIIALLSFLVGFLAGKQRLPEIQKESPTNRAMRSDPAGKQEEAGLKHRVLASSSESLADRKRSPEIREDPRRDRSTNKEGISVHAPTPRTYLDELPIPPHFLPDSPEKPEPPFDAATVNEMRGSMRTAGIPAADIENMLSGFLDETVENNENTDLQRELTLEELVSDLEKSLRNDARARSEDIENMVDDLVLQYQEAELIQQEPLGFEAPH